MTVNELQEYIKMGREIEFNLEGHQYFIQPDYDDPHYGVGGFGASFALYDCADPKAIQLICVGTVWDILAYRFNETITLKDNFDKFFIEYIL